MKDAAKKAAQKHLGEYNRVLWARVFSNEKNSGNAIKVFRRGYCTDTSPSSMEGNALLGMDGYKMKYAVVDNGWSRIRDGFQVEIYPKEALRMEGCVFGSHPVYGGFIFDFAQRNPDCKIIVYNVIENGHDNVLRKRTVAVAYTKK